MRSLLLMLGLSASLGLGACVSTPADDRGTETAVSAEVPQRGLPPRTLANGECGLFLWSVSGEPTFIFFSRAASQQAAMWLGGAEVALREEGAAGDIFGQFLTEQTWRVAANGQQIELLLEPGEPLLDGQRVEGGRLKVIDAEGWETIIPISGARACRSTPDPAVQPPAP